MGKIGDAERLRLKFLDLYGEDYFGWMAKPDRVRLAECTTPEEAEKLLEDYGSRFSELFHTDHIAAWHRDRLMDSHEFLDADSWPSVEEIRDGSWFILFDRAMARLYPLQGNASAQRKRDKCLETFREFWWQDMPDIEQTLRRRGKVDPGITYDTVFPWIRMKRSSVLFTELDRRLRVSNNDQSKRKYKKRIKNAGKIDNEKNKEILTKGQ